MYVTNHFNHCIKLLAPCEPLIGNKKFLFLFYSYKLQNWIWSMPMPPMAH